MSRFFSILFASFLPFIFVSQLKAEETQMAPRLLEVAQKTGLPKELQNFASLDNPTIEYLIKILKRKQGNVSESQILKRKVAVRSALQNKNYYNAIDNLEHIIPEQIENYHNWSLYLYALVEQEKEYDAAKHEEIAKAKNILRRLATNPLEHAVALWIWGGHPKTDKAVQQEAVQLTPEKDIKSKIESLIEHYPPKLKAYELTKPDAQGYASVCLNLTHPLPQNKGIDYTPYISVEPVLKDYRVSGKNSNICVDGFDYGRDYTIHLKSGIQAANQLKLKEAQTFNVYVEHRKPRLAFRERGYILPSSGPQILPMNTLNIKESQLALYHIPERGIAGLDPQEFFKNIRGWDAQRLKTEKGQRIWEGKLTTEASMNNLVTHGIALNKLLPKQLESGVYFLTAGIKKEDNANDEQGFSTQFFVVSDIGLSLYQGPQGVHVYANSLGNAKPIEAIELNLIARNNRILGKLTTDDKGHALFPETLTAGKDGNTPEFVFAQKGEDFTFLKFEPMGFDLKDRGVQGRNKKTVLDGYLYSEKGIYRPGEDVHLTALLRADQKAFQKEKITLKLFKPNHQEAYTSMSEDQGAGSYVWEYTLPSSSYQGNWTAQIFHDPKGDPISEIHFEVNDFVPPKLDVRLHNLKETMKGQENFQLDVNANYYYGAPGNDLDVSGDIELKKADHPFQQWKEASFGFEEEPFKPIKLPLEKSKTDEKGYVHLVQDLKIQSDYYAPLSINARINVFEPAGRPVSKTTQSILYHQPFYIGINPLFKDKVANGSEANFEIFTITSDSQLIGKPKLSFVLYEEEYDYVWYRASNDVNFERNIRDKVLSRGEIETKEEKPSALRLPIQYGRYRLEVTDPETGMGSSIRFASGWSYAQDHPDRPDLVDLQVDKKSYKTGETLVANIKAPFKGFVNLLAIGQEVTTLFQGEVDSKGHVQHIELSPHLCKDSGFYLVATAIRPLDAGNQLMPGRAIGITWVSLNDVIERTELRFELTKDIIRPNTTFVSKLNYEKGLKDAYATIALVDEAVLNLTNYKSPNPLSYFSSQIDLAYSIFDSYGKLINPFGAVLNDSLVGGDGMMGGALSILPGRSFKTLLHFTGVLPLDESGEMEFSFDLPEFDGKARLMAVLWSDKKLGQAEQDLYVRDDVVHDLSLPRFIAQGDETKVPFMMHNLEGPEGKYSVSIKNSDTAHLSPSQLLFNLARNAKETQNLTLLGNKGLDGIQHFGVHIEGPSSYRRDNNWQISLRSPFMEQVKREFSVLQKGQSLHVTREMLEGFDPAQSKIRLELSGFPSFGVQKISHDLREYPYTCLEQTSSSIYGFLVDPKEYADKIQQHLSRLYQLQDIQGLFMMWPDSYYFDGFMSSFAVDTLLTLKAANVDVSEAVLHQGLKSQNAKIDIDVEDNNPSLLIEKAYAHYILAKANKNAMSQIRYFADNHKKAISSSMIASAFVAGTYAHLGDKNESFDWFKSAFQAKSGDYRSYGSSIRDLALVLSIVAETSEGYPQLMEKARELAAQLPLKTYLSTQEMAWILRLHSHLEKAGSAQEFSIDDEKFEGKDVKPFLYLPQEVESSKKVVNHHNNPLFVSISAEGKIAENGLYDKEIRDKGFTIVRELYTTEGTKITENQFTQGELYIVVLKGEIEKPLEEQIVVADLLPAGFEIENPHLYKTPDLYPFLSDLLVPLMAEGRDDRFVASFKGDSHAKSFTLAYMVRASFQGSYAYPAPFVESMYRPEIHGLGIRGQIKVVKKEVL